MKKVISAILLLSMCFAISACSLFPAENNTTEQAQENVSPDVTQMKAICELATMECYYHNVAKYNEEDASGALWWKKDRTFWIEYAGVVRIGIDISQVSMNVEEDVVTITIPQAEVLDCKVDESTLTEDSFIIAEDSAKVEAEHQTAAFKEAQDKMEQAAAEDSALLASAQQRAQELLGEYVENIGDATGKSYEIKWVYLQDTETTQETDDAVTTVE